MTAAQKVSAKLRKLANTKRARILADFFKTGKGEYGEGDVFYGVTVPLTRKIAAKYAEQSSLHDIHELLQSKVHEERLAALLILADKFQRGNPVEREHVFNYYLRNAARVNNWDLVDLSADKILGAFLERKSKSVLYKLAKSSSVWERRIAVVATFHFIKNGDARETYEVARMLLRDGHDLIQKAVGWMLREAGKRCSQEELENFLDKHAAEMPRTMLRYAIERLPQGKKKTYLQAGRK